MKGTAAEKCAHHFVNSFFQFWVRETGQTIKAFPILIRKSQIQQNEEIRAHSHGLMGGADVRALAQERPDQSDRLQGLAQSPDEARERVRSSFKDE